MIDPRWVSTPIGAAIGVVLARKIMRPKDRTPGKVALGGVLGGAAGYTVGTLMKGDPYSLVPTGDRDRDRQAWLSYLRKAKPTGIPTPSELAVVGSFRQIYPESINPNNPIRMRWGARSGADLEAFRVYSERAKGSEELAKAEKVPEERKALMDAAQANAQMAKEHWHQITNRKLAYGADAMWDVIKRIGSSVW